MAKYSKASLDKLKGVHPKLVQLMNEVIKETPIDFTIVSGVRTTTEQKALYAQGRTIKGSIVTNADGVKNKSNHQAKSDGYGHAIDFCPYVNGKLDWDTHANFRIIAAHILATAKCLGIKVEWGGNWKFLDLPHIELK